MTTLKLGLGALAIAGVIGALVVQLYAQRTLRAENESLSGQVAQLKVDNEQLSNQVTANADSLATQKDQSAELLRLRAEVTQLRAMKTAPTMAAAPATNNSPVKKRMEIVFEVKFVSIPTRTVPSFGAGWTTVGPNTSLLSDQQFAVVDAAIRNKDLDWVTAARITTSSGIEAISRMTDQVQVDGTNADVGETMDVLPYFSSDSSNVTLNLAATLNQLIGDPSNPGLFTTQMSNQVSVAPGQTVVLKGEIPAGAWMQRTDDKAVVPLAPDGPMNLLVFVTPTLINARGEPQTAMADVSRENLMEKMNEAKQGVLALVMFAEDNGKQYPTNLDDAARYMKNDFMKTVASNFDFLNPGSITNVAQPATTIVLKEKQAWQGPDGGWLKAYGFADGHAEIHKEPAGNFDEFEKEHTLAESGQ